MSTLLAIDSGHPECAFALASRKRLSFVGSASAHTWEPLWSAPNRVVFEVPTIRGDATPNPEDLLLIAVAGARLAERAARGAPVVEYRPREWKGNTPKPPHHARMWEALTAEERALLGGDRTHAAILAACKRGAQGGWRKPGATYYRAGEFPSVNGTKITHDLLDASALALYDLGRIPRG